MSESRSLWDAVDRLVAPTRVKIDRQASVESGESWLIRAGADPAGACWVPSHDKALATHRSASVVWATVPSLWEQSSIALYGSESGGGGGSKPLRERSIADFNLIEIRAQIVEGVRFQQELRGETPSTEGFVVGELRHIASLIHRVPPEQVKHPRAKDADSEEAFAFRLLSWSRALETYLNAGEHEVRPVRLRNSPCPTCKTAQVVIAEAGERVVAPALVIRFRDGLVQAAVCEACGDAWWRGPDLEALAELLGVNLYGTPDASAIA